jgi:hypothetical protein
MIGIDSTVILSIIRTAHRLLRAVARSTRRHKTTIGALATSRRESGRKPGKPPSNARGSETQRRVFMHLPSRDRQGAAFRAEK